MTDQCDPVIIERLRGMAREGCSPSALFNALKEWLGAGAHILVLLRYLRRAFSLSLKEVKPFGELTRNDGRVIEDEALLDELVAPDTRRYFEGLE